MTLEVPAPAAGTIGEISAAEGTNVPVGAVLATIADGAAAQRRHRQPSPRSAGEGGAERAAIALPRLRGEGRVAGCEPRQCSTAPVRRSASWWPKAASMPPP